MKWKYSKEKPRFDYEEYLKLEKDKTTKLKVKFPEVTKKLVDGEYRSVFVCTVIEVDGEPTEKIFTIKNYKNVMFLKPKIGKKKQLIFEITRKYDDDILEIYYDIKMLKE